MRMKRSDLILVLIALCQDRQGFGRTSLQKVAYFVALALGVNLGHRAYYYGPFSDTVEQDVEALALSDLVDETVRPLGFVNQQGFAGRQYKYSVTESGMKRVDAIRSAHGDEYDRVDSVVSSFLERFSTLDQATLSAAAKVVYLTRREGHELSESEIGRLARDLGWNLAATTVRQVRSLVELDPAFSRTDPESTQ